MTEKRDKIVLNNDNILLRGTTLRNTPYIYGVVIYTGQDSKIQMNSTTPRYKNSKLTNQTNTHIITLFIVKSSSQLFVPLSLLTGNSKMRKRLGILEWA
jgi:magnesium-transporting ATPase (P-type)